MLFWFCKFKDFLNSIKRKGLKLFFVIFSLIGNFPRILLRKRNIWVVGMTTILLPCFINIYFIFGGKIGFKKHEGFQLANISGSQKFAKIRRTSPIDFSIMFQENDLRKKCISKFTGSLIEIISPISAFAEDMRNASPKQSKDRTNKQADNVGFIHFIIGCVCGSICTAMGTVIYLKMQ